MASKSPVTDPWRLRCPKGHATIEIGKSGYRCESCGGRYHGEPYDASKTDFPVTDPTFTSSDREEVLEALVEYCDHPNHPAILAKYLARGTDRADRCVGSYRQVVHALTALEEDGLVERGGRGEKRRGFWWPTEAGIERVRGGDD